MCDVHLRYFNFILIFCSRLPIFEAGKHESEAGIGVKVAKGKIQQYGGASETTTVVLFAATSFSYFIK